MTELLAIVSGGFVGSILGLIGGGGSIVATPLLVYLVGLPPHVAIGTGALAVSANAFASLGGHARAGNVRWAVAAMFTATGACGALIGSTVGKAFDGQRLILLFAIMMLVVGALMLRPRRGGRGTEPATLSPTMVAKVAGIGLGVGVLSGFFGIGGGFLIVPGLIFATGMPMICAIGTSLLSVGAFGSGDRAELCSLRHGELDGGRGAHRWRPGRRLGRHEDRLSPCRPAPHTDPVVRGASVRGRHLHHLPLRAAGVMRWAPSGPSPPSLDHRTNPR